jgi:uncharacterized protein
LAWKTLGNSLMLNNILANETSPYLLQHKDNPVHWQTWDPDALALAQKEDKPILLSIGYSACHWCHVMAHESFEDADTAEVMNASFINIKVDREERPDLDAFYQSALGAMGGHGGWPLTVFLTPDGTPFWGGTYFPPTAHDGYPSFKEVLCDIASAYKDKRGQVADYAATLKAAMAAASRQPQGNGAQDATFFPDRAFLNEAAEKTLSLVDFLGGGTLGAPKFPQPELFSFLWRSYLQSGSLRFHQAVCVTLDAVCQGGIYDHLAGGFARYSTDENWLVPHFEKMLYDNALLVELLCEVWRKDESPLYATRVDEVISWMLEEMRVTHKSAPELFALAGAIDADSDGKEGAHALWRSDEIDALLGADAFAFKKAYGVSPQGNWQGLNILNRSHVLKPRDIKDETALAEARQKLLTARRKRPQPQRDDKVLADWNAMAIGALAKAGMIFNKADWCAAAIKIFDFVLHFMGDGHRLRHSWRDGANVHAKSGYTGLLDDYAQMARAAMSLFEATGDERYLDHAKNWVAYVDAHHWDGEDGGYFLSSDETTDVIIRTKPLEDRAVPSGNGVMMEVLARLFHTTGETTYRDRAEDLARALVPQTPGEAIPCFSLLCGTLLLDQAILITVSGEAGPCRDLVWSVTRNLSPNSIISYDQSSAPKGALGRAHVCYNGVCGPFVEDGDSLRQELSKARQKSALWA